MAIAAMLATAALGQEISQAVGDSATGQVTINTTAPAAYTSVTIKVCDKDGNVILTQAAKPGDAVSFEIGTPGTDLKVYATFTKTGGENVQGPKVVSWS